MSYLKKIFTTASETTDGRSRSSASSAAGANARRAFTLIELLVVIAIIGILSSVVLASLNGARESARDSRRQSDLNNIRTALSLYVNNNGEYPAGLYNASSPSLEGSEAMNVVPKDPSDDSNYGYASGSTGDAYDVCLGARLEGSTAPDNSASSTCGSVSGADPGSGNGGQATPYYLAI